MKRCLLLSIVFVGAASSQVKWYRFSKAFIESNYSSNSAFGVLHARASFPAKNVHTISCGGNDGELHVGIPANAIVGGSSANPISGIVADPSNELGMVAEPPNANATLLKDITSVAGSPIEFQGYYRVWNEGHDVGKIYPSNPHHVLEMHPAWAFRSGTVERGNPRVIYPMQQYHGYGFSKYGPLFRSIATNQWLRVAEDADYVYVQLIKADNFYQIPVVVKTVRRVQGGIAALVDVYSDGNQRRIIYPNLTVIAAAGTKISTALAPNRPIFLLGFFSVNLRKAMVLAAGHIGTESGVFAPAMLEYFTFGVPLQQSVPSSKAQACSETEDEN